MLGFSARDRRIAFGGNNAINRVFGGRGFTEQMVGITDMISEGPIGGLVEGGASVYLNNDALFNASTAPIKSKAGESVTYADDGRATKEITINEFNTPFSYDQTVSGDRFLIVDNIKYLDNVKTKANGGVELISQDWQDATYKFNFDSDVFATYTINNNSVSASSTYEALPVSIDVSTGQELYKDKVGLATVIGANKSRQRTGYITAITSNSITIAFKGKSNFGGPNGLKFMENQESGDFEIYIHEVLKINTISTTAGITKITTVSHPAFLFTDSPFTITAPITDQDNFTKYEGSSYQFRDGSFDQEGIQTLQGVGSSTVAIAPVGELPFDTTKTITASGAQASEIDSVEIMFNYPGGLYMMNTEGGSKEAAGSAYEIKLRVYNNDGDGAQARNDISLPGAGLTGGRLSSGQLEDLKSMGGGNSSLTADSSVYAHGGKFLSSVSFSHVIDLEKYQPFAKFDIRIRRITNSENMTDAQDGRAHCWTGNDGVEKLRWRGSNVKKWQAVQTARNEQVLGVIKEKLNYPFTALAHVNFNAKSFSSPPVRTYECYGLKVAVPENYTTREEKGLVGGTFADVKDLYTGIWTGNFRSNKVYTDNPAWIFYDIITNNRYGIGEFISDNEDIDKFSLYRIARYCDELVPDGKGGKEPRFRGNFYFQKATDIYKVLKDMATNFRAMLYWMDGKLTPVIDEKRSPIYSFNRTNVVDGKFEYQSTGSKTRSNQIIVSWSNPASDYKLEPLIIEDRENIIETGQLIKEEGTAFGCTSEGQAIRYGRWKLWTAINQTEMVTFSTLNGAFLSPGDIITIQDNHDHALAYSGRAFDTVNSRVAFDSDGTPTTNQQVITLDRRIVDDENGLEVNLTGRKLSVLHSGKAVLVAQESAVIGGATKTRGDRISSAKTETGAFLSLIHSLSDEEIEKRINAAYDDNGNLLSLEYASESRVVDLDIYSYEHTANDGPTKITVRYDHTYQNYLVDDGAIWGIKDDPVTVASPKEYKILGISSTGKNQYDVTAIEYYEGKFDVVDTNFSTAVEDPLFAPEGTTEVPAPTGLRVFRDPKFGETGEEVILSWEPPEDTTFVTEYEVSNGVTDPPTFTRTRNTTLYIDKVPDGIYTFAVRSMSSEGKKSVPVTATGYIDDIFKGTHPRIFGMYKGGQVNSPVSVIINETNNIYQVGFDKGASTLVHSPGDDDFNSEALSAQTNQHKIDFNTLGILNHNGIRRSWWGENQTDADGNLIGTAKPKPYALEYAYLGLIGYGSSNQLRLINYVYDPFLNIDYWYDAINLIKMRWWQQGGAADASPSNTYFQQNDYASIWKNFDASRPAAPFSSVKRITIPEGSNKATFAGTSNHNLEVGDVLWMQGNQAAKVVYVEDPVECVYIDRVFSYKTATISQAYAAGSNRDLTFLATSADHGIEVGDYVKAENSVGGDIGGNGYTLTTLTKVTAVDGTAITVAQTVPSNQPTNSAQGTYTSQGAVLTNAIKTRAWTEPDIKPDFRNDFIIGKLNYDGTWQNFCTLNPDLQATLDMSVDTNVAFVRYTGDSTPTQLVESDNTPIYDNITITATASGYSSPQFTIAGAGFSQVDSSPGVGAIPANGVFVGPDTTGGNTKAFQVDTGTTLLNGGTYLDTPAIFEVSVREENDPDNTNKIITKSVNIEKIKDGSIGLDGKTGQIVLGDNSILYDADAANPEYSRYNTEDKINVELFFTNFVHPLYKIQITAGTGSNQATTTLYDWTDAGAGATTASFRYAESDFGSTFSSANWPKVFKLQVAEKPENWTSGDAVPAGSIKATDATSLIAQRQGASAVEIVMPNQTHSYNTNRLGNIGTAQSATIPNSGTTIELLINGATATYVGNATATGKANATAMEEGQWYIHGISAASSGSDIIIGGITVSSNIVTIADHGIQNNVSGVSNPTDDTEVITYTFKAFRRGQLITKTVKQSLSKAKDGEAGAVKIEIYKVLNTVDSSGTPTYGTFNSGNTPEMTYNFTTGALAFVTNKQYGWSTTPPSISATSKYLWKLEKLVIPIQGQESVSIPDSDPNDNTTETWDTAAPVLISSFGVEGESGRTVHLDPSRQSVLFDQEGNKKSGQAAITFTATSQPDVSALPGVTRTFAFSKDVGGSITVLRAADASNTLTLVAGHEPTVSSPIVKIICQYFEDGVEKAEDAVTLFALEEGKGGLVGFLTNEAHVVPSNAAGTSYSLAGSGGEFKVFKGIGELQTNVSYSVSGGTTSGTVNSATSQGLTFSINTSSGVYTLSGATGWSSEVETFTVQATITSETPNVVLERVYSISKSKTGADAPTVQLIASPVSFTKVGNFYNPDSTSTITAIVEGELSTQTIRMSTQSQYGSLDSAGTQPDYSRVFTFNSNRSLQNIQDSATVNVSVDLTLNSNTTRSLATGDPMTASVVIPTVVNGENGVGANGLRIAEGYVYYSHSSRRPFNSRNPGNTNTVYTWADGIISNMNSNWQQSPPEMAAGTQGKYYYSRYIAYEVDSDSDGTPDTTSSGSNLVFNAPLLGHNFSGLVTFQPDSNDPSTGTLVGTNVTTINGGQITTGSLAANKLSIGNQAIGNNTSTMKLYSNKLDIFENGTLRVRLGDLSDTSTASD